MASLELLNSLSKTKKNVGARCDAREQLQDGVFEGLGESIVGSAKDGSPERTFRFRLANGNFIEAPAGLWEVSIPGGHPIEEA